MLFRVTNSYKALIIFFLFLTVRRQTILFFALETAACSSDRVLETSDADSIGKNIVFVNLREGNHTLVFPNT